MTAARLTLRACLASALCALYVACGGLLPARAQTQPKHVMTLQQAVDFALVHNSDVLKAQADADAAGATLAAARAITLPTVNAELQNQLDKSQNSGAYAQIGAVPSSNFSLNTAGITGNFNGVNLTNIYQARSDKAAYDEALQRARATREQTTFDVEQSFYTLVSDTQLVQIADEDVAYNRALTAIAEANFKAGKVAGLDQLKAQVAYTSALERLATNSADEEDARENLAQLIGAGIDQQFDVPATVPEPPEPPIDIKSLDTLALSNRPEVAIAQAALDSAYISYNLVDAPNLPNVALSGAWGNQVSPTSNAQNFDFCRSRGFTVPECLPGPSHFYEISVVSTWTLPLLDWGTVHSGHNSARHLIEAQRTALTKSQQQALVDVDQAARRILVSRDNVRLSTANVDVARKAALISAVQYKVGLITQTDVAAAQQAYLNAARDLLAAQVTYVLSLAKLKLATGTLTGAI